MPWRLGCPAVLHWHRWRGGVAREFGVVPGANLQKKPHSFCEEDYAVTLYVAEILNSFSSVTYCIYDSCFELAVQMSLFPNAKT